MSKFRILQGVVTIDGKTTVDSEAMVEADEVNVTISGALIFSQFPTELEEVCAPLRKPMCILAPRMWDVVDRMVEEEEGESSDDETIEETKTENKSSETQGSSCVSKKGSGK